MPYKPLTSYFLKVIILYSSFPHYFYFLDKMSIQVKKKSGIVLHKSLTNKMCSISVADQGNLTQISDNH